MVVNYLITTIRSVRLCVEKRRQNRLKRYATQPKETSLEMSKQTKQIVIDYSDNHFEQPKELKDSSIVDIKEESLVVSQTSRDNRFNNFNRRFSTSKKIEVSDSFANRSGPSSPTQKRRFFRNLDHEQSVDQSMNNFKLKKKPTD